MAKVMKQPTANNSILLIDASRQTLRFRLLGPKRVETWSWPAAKLDQVLLPALNNVEGKFKGRLNLQALGVVNSGNSFAASRILLSVLNTWSWLKALPLLPISQTDFDELNWSQLQQRLRQPHGFVKPSYQSLPDIGRSSRAARFTWRA